MLPLCLSLALALLASAWPLLRVPGLVSPHPCRPDLLPRASAFIARSKLFAWIFQHVAHGFPTSWRHFTWESSPGLGLLHHLKPIGLLHCAQALFVVNISFGELFAWIFQHDAHGFRASWRHFTLDSSPRLGLLQHLSPIGSLHCVLALFVMNISFGEAVCATCKDSCDGCTGGAACPWLTGVASNAAAVLATATTGLICAKTLLPPGLLSAFPRSALDTILLLARMPAAGTPFSLTSTTTAADLRMAYRQGRISKSDVAEGISTLITNAPDDQITRLQLQIKTLELELSEPEPQGRTELGGAYMFILAKISQFVLKNQAPVWARTVQERAGTSLASALHFPVAEVADGAVPMMAHLFTTFLHAFGLEHIHTVAPFIQRVVHDSVWLQDFTWQYALELLVVYLKALDDRRTGISMANIWHSGSQDTFTKTAEKAAIQRWGPSFAFFRAHGGNPGTKSAAAAAAAAVATDSNNSKKAGSTPKWNGKWTAGAKPCLTFNNGRDVHPRTCLLADGTCRFDHVCDHFVEGGGKCGSKEHGRHSCSNSARVQRNN